MDTDADNGTALSDFEEDEFEPAPVVLPVSSTGDAGSSERLKAALADLNSEKQARLETEKAKAELESSFARLKLLSQQAIKQRDEALRQKDEALKLKDDLNRQLAEAVEARNDALTQRDEIIAQRDEITRQKEEALKSRDTAKAEIEAASRLLVSASDSITSMVSGVKAFSGVLPRTTKYTGVAAIAYGFSKRIEEVVEEVLRQRESAIKGRNEMHNQIEQRNIQIAIEVSQLEASVSELKEEIRKKAEDSDRWQKIAAEKDRQMSQLEQDMQKRIDVITKDAELSTKRMTDAESRVISLEAELQKQNEMLAKQFQVIYKASGSLIQLSQILHADGTLQDTFSIPPSFQAHEIEKMHEASLRALRSISDLASTLTRSWQETEELRQKERKELQGKMERLTDKEKEVTALLRSVLANKEEYPNQTRKSPSIEVANVDGLRQNLEGHRDEAITLASALDIEVNYLRREVLELEKSLSDARSEAERLRILSNTQAKELTDKSIHIEELERVKGILTHNVEAVSAQVLTLQEEVVRWKDAATQEANAGVAVLEEVEKCNEEITLLNGELAEVRKALQEVNLKLQAKEEMAAAAVAAQNAAERSLRIADERAADLRERLEGMARQLDEAEGRIGHARILGTRLLDLCCPWLRGRGRRIANMGETGEFQSAEMGQLLEPLV